LTFEPIAFTHRDPNEPSKTPLTVTKDIILERIDDGAKDEIANEIAGNDPVTLAPKITPALSVVAAFNVVIRGEGSIGLITPGIVKVMVPPAGNIPLLNVMVKTVLVRVAVARAPKAGIKKVTA
jgi:hypothetical protein